MDLPQKLSLLARAEPFKLLDDRVRAELAGHLTEKAVAYGENVFVHGDVGDAMYIIASGKARVVGTTLTGEEATLALLGPGESFGETALTSDAPRNATVRAAYELTLLRLERGDFDRLIAQFPTFVESLRRYLTIHGIQNFLKQSTAMQHLPAHILRELIGEMQEMSIPNGHVVVREGETGDRFYVVCRGVLEAVRKNGDAGTARVLGQIGEGEYFGELAMMSGKPRSATVVARSECVLYAMTRLGFERALAASPQFRARLESHAMSYREAPSSNGDTPVKNPSLLPEPAAASDESKTAPDDETASVPKPPRRWFRRYPHLLQHDETDCGAACLAMICLYYGVPVGIARLRDMANVDADGSTMWSVAQAAEALGFHARGYQMGYEALADLTLPAIIHWEGFHYIVLYEVTPKRVVVADPGLSLRRLDRDTFCTGWTGRVLEMIPTAKLHTAERIRSPVRRFWPIVKPHLPLLGEVLAASLLLSILGLGVPLFTQVIVDRVLVNKSVGLLNMLLVGMLMIAGFQATLSAIRRVLLVHVSVRADARLIGDFLRHVMGLPMKFFDLRRVGDVVSRVTENEKVRAAITGAVPGALVDTVLTVGYVGLMFAYNAKLALVSLAAIPPFVLFIIALTPAMRRTRREHSARDADAWSSLIESITGISTIKSMATESSVRWRMEGQYVQALLAAKKSAHLQVASQTAAALLQSVSTTLLLWYGAVQVMQGNLTVGQLLAFATLLAGIIGPSLRLIDAWDQLQDLRNGLERLNDIFDARPEQDTTKALIHPPHLTGDIRFEAVTFRYSPSQERPALAGFSVDIAAGKTIAVVGRSGSGKSTLAKLILGFYPPTQGRVSIDGHDLRMMSLTVLRRCIGVVQQEVFLFSGTVRENIAAGDADVPFEKVVQAAKAAGAHEFISALGLGYDTKVGERGMSLSGGQRQRIALARALLHDPSVLVLDEATSALDTESERAIQRNLEASARKRTTIVIAHRLSTVRNADRILVLDNGTLVEQGTHDELVSRGGLYQTLVGQQLHQQQGKFMQSTESPQIDYQQAMSDKTLPGRAIFASRALFYTVLLMATAAFTWAALTKVDVVVEARGRLTVQGEPMRISVSEPARVDEVAVHVGDHVRAGQLLLRLDAFHWASETRRLLAERDAARAEGGRLHETAAATHKARPLIERQLELAAETEKLISGQLTLVRSLDRDFSAAELQRKEIDLQDTRTTLSKAHLALDQNEQDEANATAQAAAADLHAQALQEQLSLAEESQKRASIVAPTDGTITQMAASQPGIMIGLAEPAVVLIPDGQPLNAEVRIPNGSMRRLTPGLPVRVRFDAFPHEDFGYLQGILTGIDPDADADGLYHGWVRLDRMEMPGPQGNEKLRPGLQLDARIVVDRESVLHLVLRPVRKFAERGTVNQ